MSVQLDQSNERLDELLDKYFDEKLTLEEGNELNKLLESSEENFQTFLRQSNQREMMYNYFNSISEKNEIEDDIVANKSIDVPFNRLNSKAKAKNSFKRSNGKKNQNKQNKTVIYQALVSAAACCFIYFSFITIKDLQNTPISESQNLAIINDLIDDLVIIRAGKIVEDKNLLSGDLIKVASQSLRFKYLNEDTVININPHTELLLKGDANKKSIELYYGSVEASVQKQNQDQSMLFKSPLALGTVLGTKLKWSHNDGVTQLMVTHGSVRMTHLKEDSSVVVSQNQYANISDSQGPIAYDMPSKLTRINFGPADSEMYPEYLHDSGMQYDAKKGYGWIDSPVETLFHPLRKKKEKHTLDTKIRASLVSVGSDSQERNWRISYPNGQYELKIVVGDYVCEQGPHYIECQGKPIINHQMTDKSFIEKSIPVLVDKGYIELSIGGKKDPDNKVSFDGTTDSTIAFIEIKKIVNLSK